MNFQYNDGFIHINLETGWNLSYLDLKMGMGPEVVALGLKCKNKGMVNVTGEFHISFLMSCFFQPATKYQTVNN